MSQPVRYVFVVQPVEAYEPLLPGTVMVIKTVLGVDGPMGNGPARFIGICEATDDAHARGQLDERLARLPASVPDLVITELYLATR